MLSVSHLTKQVTTQSETLTILQDISFQVTEGESIAILGASGSGKSTLLSLLAGLDQSSDGNIEILGHSLTTMDEEALTKFRADHVGFVFQSFHLLPTLTAVENVSLPLELKKIKHARKIAEDLLKQVGLSHRLKHYPNQMSGGEQQRVAIARAFSTKPKLLFADEPTGNLDTKTGSHIADLLFELNRVNGTTLFLVTHDETLAHRCSRSLRLSDGRLMEQSHHNIPFTPHDSSEYQAASTNEKV